MGQIERALELIHSGRLQPARILCSEVLAREPRNFNALQLLGHIALQEGDYASAASSLAEARAINPKNPAVCSNLAVALLALGRPRDALACCDSALGLVQNLPEAHCNRGHALAALGRPDQALESYERALAHVPAFLDAHAGRSRTLIAQKRFSEALDACDRLLRIDPRSLEGWSLRGTALLSCKRTEDALAAFDRAIDFHPHSAEAHNNRGTALRDLRRPTEALASYEQALRLRPAFAEVYCNVANVGLDTGRYEEALGHCDRALQLRPGYLEALNIRGTALRLLKRYTEAASTYEELLAISPQFGHAQNHLLFSRANLCDWRDRTELIARVVESNRLGMSVSSPHSFLWMHDSAAAQWQCAVTYTNEQFPATAPLWSGELYAHERIRVAYLSADFSDHPVSHLIAGVLEHHDRTRFETFGISLFRERSGGAMQARMSQAFEHFHEVETASDRDIGALLRAARVDIVVDLNGHTRGGRPGVMASRPAPVQVNFLGFAGTSGASYMDYIIGDAVTIPRGEESFFTEQVIRMPHSFLPNDDQQVVADAEPSREELGLPVGGFVFCAFNNPYKLNPVLFDIWMRLLEATPGSVLWMRAEAEAVQANLRREAEARAIAADRLVFAPRLASMAAHLARYRRADLFLDTWPYGAHATARDALWAGTPVLTYAGASFASRVAASLLTGLGLSELITGSLDDYASRALTLAHSPAVLGELREALQQRRAQSPVFATELYCRHLESAYASLVDRQRRGVLPTTLEVHETSG